MKLPPPARIVYNAEWEILSCIDTENPPLRLQPGRIILDKSQTILSCGETWHLLLAVLHAQQVRSVENRP